MQSFLLESASGTSSCLPKSHPQHFSSNFNFVKSFSSLEDESALKGVNKFELYDILPKIQLTKREGSMHHHDEYNGLTVYKFIQWYFTAKWVTQEESSYSCLCRFFFIVSLVTSRLWNSFSSYSVFKRNLLHILWKRDRDRDREILVWFVFFV